jgi:hypothetical protein
MVAVMAIALIAVLAVPMIAEAGAIQINSGVSGAKLGATDVSAAKKIGQVKKKAKDTRYSSTIWVRFFGKKSHGHYAVEMYSNGHHKVTGFIIYSSKYSTAKKIHVGSSTMALLKAYGKKLHSYQDGYYLRAKSGKTYFELSKGKVRMIWVSRT